MGKHLQSSIAVGLLLLLWLLLSLLVVVVLALVICFFFLFFLLGSGFLAFAQSFIVVSCSQTLRGYLKSLSTVSDFRLGL